MTLTAIRQFPSLTPEEAATLNAEVFASARHMTNDQLLDLADGLHDILRARQAIHRRAAEHLSFAAAR